MTLFLAGCEGPAAPTRQGYDTGTTRSRRSWRNADRPIESERARGSSLRAWRPAPTEGFEQQELALSALSDEPLSGEVASTESPGLSEPDFTTPPVESTNPAQELAQVVPLPEPIEGPVPEDLPTPLEAPVPAEVPAPAPIETPTPLERTGDPAPPVDPAQMVDVRASIVLRWYLQRDGSAGSLRRSELEQAFPYYDWNKNGVVNELEFDASSRSSVQFGREPTSAELELLGDVKALDALLAAVDSNGDEAFSLSELWAFYDRRFAAARE